MMLGPWNLLSAHEKPRAQLLTAVVVTHTSSPGPRDMSGPAGDYSHAGLPGVCAMWL